GNGSLQIAFGQPQADSNTAALWHFEETGGTGAYIKDSSTNANNGTPTGTTSVDGFFGKARNFGGSDIVNAGNGTSLQITGALSVEAWVKTSAAVATRGIVAKMSTGAPNYGYVLRESSSGYAEFGVSGTGSNYINITSGSLINDGKWHHIAGTYVPSTSLKIYVDGNLLGTNTTSIPASIYNSAGSVTIGCTYSNTTECMIGNIDEAKISNVTKTNEQISEDYRGGQDKYINKTISSTDLSTKTTLPFYVASDRIGTFLNATIGKSAYANYQPDGNTAGFWHLDEKNLWSGEVPTNMSGLAAMWHMNESSGSTVYDTAGSNNGTVTGTTVTSGIFNNARNFNGTSDLISVTGNMGVTSLPFTVEAWVYFPITASSNNCIIRQNYNASYYYGFWFCIDSGNSIEISYGNGGIPGAGSRQSKLSATGVVPVNQWVHIAATVTASNNMSIYVNGTDVGGTYSGTGSTFATSSDTTQIGASGTLYYDGKIDELRIYTQARTAAEIQKDAVSGTPNLTKDPANRNDGTAYNTTYVNGKIGGALNFNGTNSYVNIPDSASLRVGSPNFTFESWINPSSSPSEAMIGCKEGSYEWAIRSGTLQWAIRNTSPGWTWI
ncbi:MAG: LamG domain-containing protein, partial [Patescibacteria group bacterium]|nr:LamG domain-containing protein [Patescibacteria group bacterium]